MKKTVKKRKKETERREKSRTVPIRRCNTTQRECATTAITFMGDREKPTSVNTLKETTTQRVSVKTATSIHTINTKGRKLMIIIDHKTEFSFCLSFKLL